MAKILDGKAIAEHLKGEIKKDVEALKKRQNIEPCLAVILVGDNPASHIYVKHKLKSAAEVGIKASVKKLPEDVSQSEILNLIETWNLDPKINGILVQMPLPEALNSYEILQSVSPLKDVDGLHCENIGALCWKRPKFVACTASGVMHLLRETGVNLTGKHSVIVGSSNLVGRPLAQLLLTADSTVTVAHSKTENLSEVCKMGDIVIVAVGKQNLITAEMVKEGAIVIDVGINKDLETGRIIGDVSYGGVSKKASFITPVPKGVGPMTIAYLLKNIVLATSFQSEC